MAGGSPPEVVADCIAEAITTDTPKLRWLTGYGAARNIRIQDELPFAERASLWNDPDEDKFFRLMLAEE
jgi:hypothetical protein